MLPPDYLINHIEPIALMYSDLHTAILESIARHIADTLRATGEAGIIPSAVYQIERLQELGVSEDEIIDYLAERFKDVQAFKEIRGEQRGILRDEVSKEIYDTLGASRAVIRQLFEDAAVKSVSYDNRVYEAAGLTPIAIKQSPEMLRTLDAGISKTLGSIERLTGTIAINTEEKFEELLNLSYNKVMSGAYSYTAAIADAADRLAREGVTMFRYASGRKISVEAAVRMNVLTGANQTASKITEDTMRELGISLVRTSAHLGARNKDVPGKPWANHESWQGRIFYWKEIDERSSKSNSGNLDNNHGNAYNNYMEAKNKGKNYGIYKTLLSQSDAQLLRSIRSYARNVEEHKDKIRNPSEYVDNWADRNENYKAGIIKKWKKDILRNNEQMGIAQAIAAERGLEYE